MDHNDKLDKILREDNAPSIDVNARKRAVNLAMAEFKTAQNEKTSKKSQGFSILSRLMGKSTQSKGERSMETKTKKKFMYGGMATAMVVVLAVGISSQQLQETVDRYETKPASGEPNNFGSIASNINHSVSSFPTFGLDKLFAEKKEANTQQLQSVQFGTVEGARSKQQERVQQTNEETLERAIQEGSSAIPAPVAAPEEDPLQRWRHLQEERVGRQIKSRESEVDASVTSKDKAAKKNELFNRQNNKVVVGDAVRSPQSQPVIAEAEAMDDIAEPLNNWVRPPQDVVTIREQNRDQFEKFVPNPFKQVSAEPVSTFSSDVDTASYSFVRKTINSGRLPSPDAVRVEEMVNYFNYNYPQAQSKSQPFQPTVTVTDSPWAEGRKLMHIGIKGYQLDKASLRSNLVFLLDVSGSMNQRDKLPLVKSSMKMLLDSLHPDDTLSIVTYAGRTGVVLEPTKAKNSTTIINAMNNLRAGGGTAGAAGIELAYQQAEQNFSENAVNRVILATDGDFNVGITNKDELKRYVERKREKGIFLSVLGFGQGNYNDHMMQTLAQNGNGVAAYIDTLSEARKVLVEEASSALFPIAKDVKFQVEFNPAAVAEYRLIGYETRALKREDFNNDKIDAGDIGAGHTVTAIYEFVPVGSSALTIDPLRYGAKQERAIIAPEPASEYAFLKMRYKLPMENTSKLITTPVSINAWGSMKPIKCGPAKDCVQSVSNDTRFATAVAAFGQMLKGAQYTGNFSYDDVIALAQSGKGEDKFGYRAEFINLVRMAKSLSR